MERLQRPNIDPLNSAQCHPVGTPQMGGMEYSNREHNNHNFIEATHYLNIFETPSTT